MQKRPPLSRRAPVHFTLWERCSVRRESADLHSTYKAHKNSVGNFELLQVSRERSKKTEAVFLVGSRGLRREIEIPPGSFSFGEAKEKVEPQSLICRSLSAFPQLNHLRYRPKNILPSRRFGTRAYLLRGATQIRRLFSASLLRRETGCAAPAISARCALYACSAGVLPGAAAKAFQRDGPLSGQAD